MSTVFESLANLEQDQQRALEQIRERTETIEALTRPRRERRPKWVLYAVIILSVALVSFVLFSHFQYRKLETLISSDRQAHDLQIRRVVDVSRNISQRVSVNEESGQTMQERLDRHALTNVSG